MIIYLLNILLVFTFGILSYNYAEHKNVNVFGELYVKPLKVFNFLMLATLILTYALRWKTGTDTPGYISRYYNMGSYNLMDILAMSDKGFYLINWIDYRVFNSNLVLHNIVLGIITFCPIFKLYEKYSSDYPIASVFAILTSFYYFSFNGQRQAVAIGVYIIAYLFLCNRKYLWSILFLLIATQMHSTASLMFIVLFIVHRKTNSRIFIASTIILFTSALFMGNLWMTLFDVLETIGQTRMVSAYETEANFYPGSNILRFLVVLVPTLLGVWKYGKLSKDNKNFDELLNLNIITCVFFLAGTYSWLISRLAQYTMPFLPILIVKDAQIFSSNSKRIYFSTAAILFFIYMIVYINRDSNLLPYYFMNSETLFY